MLPFASRYMALAECPLVMATSAGTTLTITAVLKTTHLPVLVNTLLGHVSALFWSSITAISPIFFVLLRFSDDGVPANGSHMTFISPLFPTVVPSQYRCHADAPYVHY